MVQAKLSPGGTGQPADRFRLVGVEGWAADLAAGSIRPAQCRTITVGIIA